MSKNDNFLREFISKEAGEDDGGDDDDDDGRIVPEHPSPILHAPRDNISRKGNPSLRYIYICVSIYIYIYIYYIYIYIYILMPGRSCLGDFAWEI